MIHSYCLILFQRGVAIAGVKYQAIAQELYVKEIAVTKGKTHKKVRIMGRGRAGIGTMRWSHVTAKIELINFDEKISKAETPSEKSIWLKRKQVVESMKANPPSYVVQGKKPSGRRMRAPEDEPEAKASE